MLIVRKTEFIGTKVFNRRHEHAVIVNNAKSVMRVDQKVPVLQVSVGNAGSVQICHTISELVRHLDDPIRMAETLGQPRD
ncbi:hypothetical protein BHQ23_02455 [Mycobacterium gordonae]|uniref:Uncharacterized protein n=1 Tax=Mycobacterium gordonae TaxID=1778 RepID=A0A1X1VZI9_MYCGO|nr:hypothetical protein BHQ23_02455 [Mycobacterium gordonae]ORV76366.1 hypothetical protein AWC08_33350 [Mycobacterium gordonae]